MKFLNSVVLILTLSIGMVWAFDCGTSNCSCPIESNSNQRTATCPHRLGDQFLIDYQRRKIKIECYPPLRDGFTLLKGFQGGEAEALLLKNCPISDTTIIELLTVIGIPSIKKLSINKYGPLGGSIGPPYLLGLGSLNELNLNHNELTVLDKETFRDLTNVTHLFLTYNKLQLLPGIFRNMKKLKILDIGFNNLTWIEPGVFTNLTQLKHLNLYGNRLKNLTRIVFTPLSNLESLDLSTNGISTFPSDIFEDLKNLKDINLAGNSFVTIPFGLFHGNLNLQKVQLCPNTVTLETIPSGLLANLTSLTEVRFGGCNLTQIPENIFWGSKGLVNLTLSSNLLEELPREIFKDSKVLKSLILSNNKLSYISDKTLAGLRNLKELDLSRNFFTNISSGLFSDLEELEILSLAHNDLMYINQRAFIVLSNLRDVDISFNFLSNFSGIMFNERFEETKSLLQSSMNLVNINLSHNNITEIFYDWKYTMTKLRNLDLRNNSFSNLLVEELDFVTSDLTLDLSNNKIRSVQFKEIEKIGKARISNKKKDIKVLLKGNPILCDCQAFDLVRYFSNDMESFVHDLVNFDGNKLKCADPPALQGLEVPSLEKKLLTCKIPEECPDKCQCYVKPATKAFLVNCSGNNLNSFPPSLPFPFRENADQRMMMEMTWLNEINHTELDISRNRILQFPENLGPGYNIVTHWNISENFLQYIDITRLSPETKVIYLNNNNLTKLDEESLEFIKGKLIGLRLDNNPWTCDCNAKEMINLVQTNIKVQHREFIRCATGALMYDLTANAICSDRLWVVVIVIPLMAVVLGLTLALSYYRYQREIKVWLYANRLCLWFVTEEELDKDKMYDAFVSYSHQDEDFVVNKLVPGLEEDGPYKYKLCLHYRDWIVGDFIPNQIARSVEDSKRTIVVLSPNFLASIWGKMEFRTAHSQALSEGRARVIVILYGDIGPTEDLDPELKAYLSMNTYVKWGDPWFWDKLRYALPHPLLRSKGVLSHQLNDFSALVDAPTPDPLNTPPADTVLIDPLKIPKSV